MTPTGSDEPGNQPFDGVAQYRDTCARLLELGRTLGEEQGRMTVPATPEWTVKDAYSHLAGAAADLLAGNLEGVTTDPWTEAQVLARRDMNLTEVLDEMESLGEAMESVIESFGDAMDIRLFIDQWTHEQDIRATVGVAGGVDSPIVAKASPGMAEGWTRRVAKAGLAPLVVELDGEIHAVDGEEATAVRLAVDGYEAMRVGLGRRSRAQLSRLQWSGTGDPSPYFELLVFFSIADRDVLDAR
jgi:hypothetical protein